MKEVRPDFSLCLQDEADVFDEPKYGFIISADTILKTGHQSQMSDISVYHYLANSMQDRYDIFQQMNTVFICDISDVLVC